MYAFDQDYITYKVTFAVQSYSNMWLCNADIERLSGDWFNAPVESQRRSFSNREWASEAQERCFTTLHKTLMCIHICMYKKYIRWLEG